jgi:hypothetical protein
MGLRPFGTNDSALVFGRDECVDDLLRRLQRSRFVAVVGESGAGKSSLILAGVLPALYQAVVSAPPRWRSAILRPGHRPINALAAALSHPDVLGTLGTPSDAGAATEQLESTLRSSSFGLIEAIRPSRVQESEPLIVVVDQFEELFRFEAAGIGAVDEAPAFIELLLNAASDSSVPVYVVLTLSAEFLGDCVRFRGLPEAINSSSFLVPRMNREALRSAIEGPLSVRETEATPVLVQRVLNDASEQHSLPTLQHALMRTYARWSERGQTQRPINIDDYDAIGGLTRAIDGHAEEVLRQLPDRLRLIAARVFKSLTMRGPGGRGYRRPRGLQEISAIADAPIEEVVEVVRAFSREECAFLMTVPSASEMSSDTVVDITRETLIDDWGTLRGWVEQEAEAGDTYRRLSDAAILYRNGAEALLSGARLQSAVRWRDDVRPTEAWAKRYNTAFHETMSFIAASERGTAVLDRRAERSARYVRWTMALLLASLLSLLASWYALGRLKAERQELERLRQGAGPAVMDPRVQRCCRADS